MEKLRDRAQNIHFIFRQAIDPPGLIENARAFWKAGEAVVVRRVNRADRVPVQGEGGRSRHPTDKGLKFLQQLDTAEMEVRAENRRHDQRRHGRHGERDLGPKRK